MLIKVLIAVGFGVPILVLSTTFVCWAIRLQKDAKAQ